MNRKITILSIGLALGILAIFQIRSFGSQAADISTRDSTLNVFREIQILKDTNKNLKLETEKLNDTLKQLKNRSSALKAMETEIAKYKLISGNTKIYGDGIRITISGDINAIWIIDLINELYSAGAEAISINGIRLTNQTIGIDTLPNNQILLNGIILNTPYIFETIGDNKILSGAIELPGGFAAKLKELQPKSELILEKAKTIEMEEI